VEFHTHRSPPVCFSGMIPGIILISTVVREKHSAPHDQNCSTTTIGWAPGPDIGRITDVLHDSGRKEGSLRRMIINDRMAGRENGLCAEVPTIGEIPRGDPSSIRSLTTLTRESRSNSAQSCPSVITLLRS